MKINPKRLRIKMYSFLKAFLVLMEQFVISFLDKAHVNKMKLN